MYKKFILVSAAFAVISLSTVFCEDLSANRISAQSLASILNDTYREHAIIDEDNDLKIETSMLKIFVSVDEDRELIKFFTGWKKSKNISDNRLYKILNAWNEDRIFATALTDGDYIYLEYFMSTEGGLNDKNFNGSIEWLESLGEDFGDYLEDEDAI